MNYDLGCRLAPLLIILRFNRSIGILLVVLFLALVVVCNNGCSHPIMTVEKKTPLTFGLSGSEDVQFFQIATADAVVWRIGPKQSQSLSKMGRIVYGDIPASCLQTIPKNEPAPLLHDGTPYTATAVVFDSAPVVVKFSISGNTVVQTK